MTKRWMVVTLILAVALTAEAQFKLRFVGTGVRTAADLISQLATATSGDVVRVSRFANIDLSAETFPITIPAGVTLAGQPGATVYSDTYDTYPMFDTGGAGVAIHGMTIRGPDGELNSGQVRSAAIWVNHANAVISNNTISHFSYAGVRVNAGGGQTTHITENDFSFIRQTGLGYGVVVVGAAYPLVDYNTFDEMREAIDSDGALDSGYEFAYNEVFDCTNASTNMHACSGCAAVNIHHNDFHEPSSLVVHFIDDGHVGTHLVTDNRFVHDTDVIGQYWPAVETAPPDPNPNWVRISTSNNTYGWVP